MKHLKFISKFSRLRQKCQKFKHNILNVKISVNKSLSPVINAFNMHPLRIVSVAMVAKSLHGTCSSAKDYRLPKKKMIPARLLRELRIKSLHKPSISRQNDDNCMIGWLVSHQLLSLLQIKIDRAKSMQFELLCPRLYPGSNH